MNRGKTILLNAVGVIAGYVAGCIASLLAEWIFFGLLPQIPIIPQILSWPVDYGWYALVGVYSADIFLSFSICTSICDKTEAAIRWGVLILSIIHVIRYISMMIQTLSENGFSFWILLIYLAAIGCIVVTGLISLSNEN